MRTIALLLCLLCTGCTHHILRVQSSWYIIGAEEARQPVTYLVLLNRGNTPLKIDQIILNPIRDEVSLYKDPYHDGWGLTLDRKLAPGEMLVTEASQFFKTEKDGSKLPWPRCRMPVEVNVKIVEPDRVLISEHQPALPNSLPWAWEKGCP
jgi:hypothetical protein